MRGMRSLILLCMLLVPVTAAAQSGAAKGAREQASAHFRRGVELFNDEAYRAALVEFERAYQVSPDYRLLYNIGQAKYELQDYIGVTQAYERYLSEGGSSVPPDQRAEVERVLKDLRQRAAQISLTVNRDGVDVFLDDAEVGKTPLSGSIPVNVGRHRISVRAPDGATATKIVDVAGGEIAEVSLELAAPRPEQPVGPTAPEGRPLSQTLAFVGWGVGGALLVGSLATGIMALSADSDLDAMFKKANPNADKVQDQRDKTKTLVTTTNVLLATGVVAAAAGTALWFFGPKKDKREDKASANLRLDVGLGSVGVSGRF